MNNLVISGKVVRSEVKATKSGNNMAAVDVAVRDYPNDTIFYKCLVFGKSVDFVDKFVKKGLPVIVNGKPTFDAYITKAGEAKCNPTIMVNNIELLAFDKTEEPKKEEPKDTLLDGWENASDDIPF